MVDRSCEPLERRLLPAVITPFTPRFSANANGDILFVANTLMTAPASDPAATTSQAGSGTKLNDNDFSMVYVDVDGVSSTFNSSRANLALPAGGIVLFAGLYWGANSASSSRNSVLFQAPGASGYSALSGVSTGADSTNNYQAFADVTTQVRTAGVGTYTVANVQANAGGDRHAGWALVVVYGDPAAPPRNLTVFDGLAVVNTSTPSATININGFTAPPTGVVNASVGVVAYEGDLGFTGDVIKLNGATLSDALNPANNFFNSSITHKGSRVASKNPDYVNQLGFDADVISTTGVIPNGATSASISLATTNETYLPGVVTTAIDLYAPVVSVAKGFVDLNGGNVIPGDVLEFTDTILVASGEAATRFVLLDAIPSNTTFVPGSIQVVSGANAGVKSDAAGDDQAEFDVANNRIVFRLGTGANASTGGVVGVGTSSVVRFRVRVNDAAPNGATIQSQASATFVGQSTGAALAASSALASATVIRYADLSLAQAVDDPTPNVGGYVVVTTTLGNSGPFDGTGILVNAALPSGLLFDSVVLSQGAYDPASGAWAAGALAAGGQATLSVRARVVSPAAIATTASIGSVLQPDPVPINNSASASLTPQRSDLAVTKAVDDGRPNVGGQVVFTTTLVNRGPNAATNVSIADALPAGFSLVSAVAGLGSYDQASGTWTVGTLASGGSVTLALTAEVLSPSASTATAMILSADQYDPIGGNNAASALVAPLRADLEVSTGVDNPLPTIGDVITYTVTVRNNGPDAATGVALISSGIPSDVQVLSVVVAQGTFDPATTRWTVGSIPVGASLTLVARARVNASSIAPLTVSVEAAEQYDPNTANNSSRSAVDPQEVSLSVTNIVSDPRPDLGELVTFTITVRNVGPATANGVVVESPLPLGLEFVSKSPGQGTYDEATGTWSVGSIGTSTVATLTLVARVVSPDPASVTASIVAGAISDENPGDNASTVELTPTRADLLLTLSGTDPSPNVGDEITLLFTLSNQGPDTATGVVASGSLPAGVTLLSYSTSQGTFDPIARVWSVGSVDTLSPRTLTLRVRVDSADPLVGTASIVASDQYDPDGANNGLTVTAIPQRADLSVSQAVDVPSPNVGEIVTFAVTVANAGPDAATGLSLFHVLPAGLEFVSASPGQGTYDAVTGVWVVGSLGASASQVLYVRARVTGAGTASATAGVVAVKQFDPSPAAPATVAVTPQRSDLALALVLSDATPQVGGTVAFTFTLTNDGPDAATGVAVRGLLTAGLAFDSALTSQGSFDPASGTWSAGSLASGASATFTLLARVASATPFTGAATIIAADQYDPDPGDAAATVSGTPQVVDVGVTKTVDVARPNVGDVIVLTTYVSNAGPSTATNLLVRSFVAAGLTVLEANASQGSYDPTTGIWNVGDVPAAGGRTLRLVVRVNSPNAINSLASVIAVDQFDSAPGNSAASVSILPQRSDVALTQTVDVPNPNVGQVVTFTVTASALGPDAATGVRVLQSLPAGFQFVSSSASAGGYDPATGVWTVGTVATDAPQTLTVVARVTAAGVAPVTASVMASDQYDPNPSNNAATTSADPQSADLGVVAAFDATRPNVGDIVTYTVTVRDAGPSGATGLVVSAPLPAGLELVDATPGQGTYDSAAGTWTIGPLGAGAVLTLQIRARVTGPTVAAAAAGVIAVDQFDPSAGDNAATASITPQRADLAIALTSNTARPNVGDVVTLEVSLSNVGPDAAVAATASVPLPAGLTFIGASGAGAYDSASGLWSIGNVAQGSPVVLRIQVRVDSNAAQAVTATVLGAAQFDPAAANNVAAVSLAPQQADLSLSVSADRPTPNVGELVTFRVVVVNHGLDDSTGVRIASALPPGLSLVSATASQGVFSLSTGDWEAGHLAANGAAVLTIQARVASPVATIYSASIVAADQFDPTPADRVASAIVTPQGAGLSLTASASTTSPNVGDVVLVTVALSNAGPDAAANVRVASLVPAGYTLVSAAPDLGAYDPATGAWHLPALASGSAASLALSLVVTSPVAGAYSATIVASDQYDPDRGDDLAGVTIVPQRSDLSLVAAVSDPVPNVGDTVAFTFTLTDFGPSVATGVAVSVPLPAGYTFVSALTGAGSYDPGSGLWAVGSVPSGSPVTLTISATVDVASPASVSATIIAADQYDPTTANDSASASVFPQRSDLGIAVLVSNPAPNLGETVTYTIRLTNTGPDAATNIVLRDVLPAGVTLVSAGPGSQPYDPVTGLWPVGSLAAGGELVLTLTVTVDDPDATVNRVEIASADQYDPTASNNAAETSTAPQQAELRLTGSLDQPHPNVGSVVTITFTLANLGLDDATGVLVDAALPAGLSLATATPGLGSYDPATGLWTVGGLARGATTTLTLTAVVASAEASNPRASIRQAEQYDPNLANNSAVLQLSPQRADVDLGVFVDTPRPNVGDLIVITVAAANRGPDDATGVSALSVLPAGLSFVSAVADVGAYDAASGAWSLGTLASGASATLRITARVDSAAASTVTAAVVASDQYDPDRAGDVATASLIPQAADLSLTATIDDAAPRVGQTVSITVTLANQGQDAADGVLVSSLLPAGLSLVSASTSRGSYDAATGVWSVGAVGGGAGGVLVLRALVASPAIGTALAAIAGSSQFDPDGSDDTAAVAVTPGQSNLTTTLAADTTTPNVGDVVTLTVTLSNTGPTAAGGTILLGDLPAGLTFIGAASSQGSFSPASGMWVVGDVAPGESRTLTIQVRVVAPGPQTASIHVAATDQYDPDPSDNSASITLVPRQADLSLASTVDVARPNVGDLVTITVTLTDTGPDSATGVRVTSPLPAGLEFVQAIASVGAYNPATGAWDVGAVASGASQTLQIIARVVSPDASVVTSSIGGADQFDPDASDDSAATGVVPQRASLGLNATIDNLTPGPGDIATYTVVLSNAGPDAATGVRASNLLPAGLELVSADALDGAFDPETGTWDVGIVAAGGSATLVIRVRPVSGEPALATVAVVAADQYNAASGVQASVAILPRQSDVGVSIVADDLAPDVGDVVTFTIRVGAQGPDAASGVAVAVTIPPGLTYLSADAGQGSFDPATGAWTVGSLPVSGVAVLTIRARVASPSVSTVTASVTGDEFDSDATDDAASLTLTPTVVDLSVQLQGLPASIVVGRSVTASIMVVNNGADPASGVSLPISVPAGFRVVSAGPGQGSYDPATGLWVLGDLPAGGQVTLTLTLEAVAAGSASIAAGPARSDQFDDDASNDVQAVAVTIRPADAAPVADLGLGFRPLAGSPRVGQSFVAYLQLTNAGPDAATNVAATLAIPAGLRLVSATSDFGVFDPISGLWTLNSVPSGGIAVLAVTLEALAPGEFRLAAGPVRGDQLDSDASNDAAASALVATAVSEPPTDSASLQGAAFVDLDGDGLRDPGEPPIVGATVVLQGVDSRGNPLTLTTFTDADGLYRFASLPAGTYTLELVTSTPLTGAPGTLGGRPDGGRIAEIVLADGAAGVGYSFVGLAPTPPATGGSIGGRIYIDLDRSGSFGPNDYGVATVLVNLKGVTNSGSPVWRQTVTSPDGSFNFDGLEPGRYSLRSVRPGFLRAFRTTPGSAGGAARGDHIENITIREGDRATGYDFGTLPGPGCRLAPLVVRPGGARSAGDAAMPARFRPAPRGPLIHRFVPGVGRPGSSRLGGDGRPAAVARGSAPASGGGALRSPWTTVRRSASTDR